MRKLNRVRILSESDKQLLRDLKEIILRYVPNATVILYGSAARGEREPESDIDILVILDEPISSQERDDMRSDIYYLQLDRDVVLSVMVYSKDEWYSPIHLVSPYHKNVEKDGVLL
ncbi:MAG: nucleotidyltransferase domain-containing protein [Armatimonadota bacterium]|nr:nucleotidyltransferase domain-containing protein [Armatimonadota bacterium]